MTEHKLAHILRAIADGQTVQVRSSFYNGNETVVGKWSDIYASSPFSLFPGCLSHEYRIKPKPKVKKYQWVVKSPDTGELMITGCHYADEEEYSRLRTMYYPVQRIESTMIEVEAN